MKKKRKKKMAAGMKFLFALLFTASIGLIAAGVYLMFFKNRDAYERQAEERDLADTYIDDLILKLTDPEAYEKKVQEEAKEKAERMARRKQQENAKGWDDIEKSSESAGEDESAPTYDFSDLDYEDANYYMRDGIVYTAQDLSFNRLKDVEVGDAFYLTAESGRYTYRVTNVFAVSRDEATRNYVDNFSIGSDKCYIITCGRDDGVKNYRYLDLIVEGTLEEQMPLLEYAKIRQQSEANK